MILVVPEDGEGEQQVLVEKSLNEFKLQLTAMDNRQKTMEDNIQKIINKLGA